MHTAARHIRAVSILIGARRHHVRTAVRTFGTARTQIDWELVMSSTKTKKPAFDERRARKLTDSKTKTGANGPVVYWMNRDHRFADNWALLRAAEHAQRLNTSLCIVFALAESYCGFATARHRCFMLEGLKQVAETAAKNNVGFAYLTDGDPSATVPNFVKTHGVQHVVCDMNPMREGRAWRKALADAKLCPLEEVDAHNIVPVWTASNKVEVGARTLRAKIHRLLPELLTEFPSAEEATANLPSPTVGTDPINWDAAIARARERGSAVPELAWAKPGEVAAKAVLNDFLANRLRLYEKRNDPAAPKALSGLSPWLRYGHISAQRAALAIGEIRKKVPKEAADGFIEEMVVRRELADNFVFYTPENYDQLSGQKYDWARETLQLHAGDPRPHVYTREKLEAGKTHDELWNAAQLELVHGGKMHGFMRMYWAKKILEWTASPEEALATGIYLNDKYSLDGRDPNGYVGVMWSIVGVHDQGWKEREVFGKIRYMNYDGCKRKFSIPAYVSRVNNLVRAVKAKDASATCNPGGWKLNGSAAVGASTTPKVDRDALLRLATTASKSNQEPERCLDALKALQKLPVDKESLVASGVGKLVKPLTKSDGEIAEVAKSIVESWKRVIVVSR